MTHNLVDILEKIEKKFNVEFETLDIDEKPIHVLSINNMQKHLDGLLAKKSIHNPLKDLPLWSKIWPSSFILGRFLRKLDPQDKSLLELGAGCGITSIIASRYGFASVELTDIVDDALLFAKANVLKNELSDIVNVRRVDIKDSRASLHDSRFDIIVASEILYLEDLHRPIIKCIQRHLAKDGMAVICNDMVRKRPRFFTQAKKYFNIKEQLIGVKSSNENNEEERRVYALNILEHK